LSCTQVNEKCLSHFKENPMMFFDDGSFILCSLSALRMLVQLPKMNCTGADLKYAVCSWFVANKLCESHDGCDEEKLLEQGFRNGDFEGKHFQSVTRKGKHLMVIKKFQSNTTKVHLLEGSCLLGVGLSLGVSGSPKDEMMTLTLIQNDAVIQTVERKIKQSENCFIIDVMFQKTYILPGTTLRIKVEFEKEEARYASTYSICEKPHFYSSSSYYHHCKKRCDSNMIPGDSIKSPYSCLAYLIYGAPVN
jgi:hypothetical protein